jgi:hypothetical protein
VRKKRKIVIDPFVYLHAAEYIFGKTKDYGCISATSCSAINHAVRNHFSLFEVRAWRDIEDHIKNFAKWFKPSGGGAFFFEDGEDTPEQRKFEQNHRITALILMTFIQLDLNEEEFQKFLEAP